MTGGRWSEISCGATPGREGTDLRKKRPERVCGYRGEGGFIYSGRGCRLRHHKREMVGDLVGRDAGANLRSRRQEHVFYPSPVVLQRALGIRQSALFLGGGIDMRCILTGF
jgi:hypothetical protein